MKMPAVKTLAASKLRKTQLMPNRNRGNAMANWDNCILCAANPTGQIQSFKPGMHFVLISFEIIVNGQQHVINLDAREGTISKVKRSCGSCLGQRAFCCEQILGEPSLAPPWDVARLSFHSQWLSFTGRLSVCEVCGRLRWRAGRSSCATRAARQRCSNATSPSWLFERAPPRSSRSS